MSIDDFHTILIALEGNRIVTYCNLASYAILLYDHLLTLGLEVELVWPTPLSMGKILYFATRYPALIDGALLMYLHTAPPPIPVVLCRRLYKASGWLIVWGIFISELILVFRTWAIWGRNSKLAIGLLALLHILAIPTAFFAHIGLGHVEFGPSPSPQVESCWITKNPNQILFLDYIMIVVFESVILGLTVYKGIQHLRNSNSSLVVTLYRDGVLYYVYLIAFSLLNIVVLVAAPKPGPSLILMQRVMHSILTARILLNLRAAARRDRAKKALTSSGTDTTLTVGEAGQRRRTALSSVFIGVDTWFRDPELSTQNTTMEMD